MLRASGTGHLHCAKVLGQESEAARLRARLGELDGESQRDDLSRRALEAQWRTERAPLAERVAALAATVGELEAERRSLSQQAMRHIHDSYVLGNFRGETSTLRALFAPREPPWGAGDCAAPKLLAYAVRHRLVPLALAEFWWGPPPPGGGRVEGMFFPACRAKCGPVLPFQLGGHPVAPLATYRPRPLPGGELVVRYEDARVVVVDKPAGLLSVPARDEGVNDSVLARLRRRYPAAEGPLLVHRLDLDTSGLLLAALDMEAFRLLQAQLISRRIEKRYIAWLDGVLSEVRGTVTLPLRPDLEQRPRQLVDFVHGKPACTHWELVERRGSRSRVVLRPVTGRTHQLRVHAAHSQGLNAPVTGDRLYGTAGERLMLHAERLVFQHPETQETLVVDAPAPF